jgi:hypothetical protein
MSFCGLRAPGSISGENKRNKKGSKIKQTNRSAPGLTGLAEKEEKRREVRERSGYNYTYASHRSFSLTPRHTRHTDRGYAMPHRENHDFKSAPNKETHKGGAGARIQ